MNGYGYEFIVGGGILDAGELAAYEDAIAEGQGGMLELSLRLPISEGVVSELNSLLKQAGISQLYIATFPDRKTLQIYFQKGFPWLAVIAAAVLGLIVLAILIVGWRLFRGVEEFVPAPLKPALGLLMVVGLALLVFSGVKRQVVGART